MKPRERVAVLLTMMAARAVSNCPTRPSSDGHGRKFPRLGGALRTVVGSAVARRCSAEATASGLPPRTPWAGGPASPQGDRRRGRLPVVDLAQPPQLVGHPLGGGPASAVISSTPLPPKPGPPRVGSPGRGSPSDVQGTRPGHSPQGDHVAGPGPVDHARDVARHSGHDPWPRRRAFSPRSLSLHRHRRDPPGLGSLAIARDPRARAKQNCGLPSRTNPRFGKEPLSRRLPGCCRGEVLKRPKPHDGAAHKRLNGSAVGFVWYPTINAVGLELGCCGSSNRRGGLRGSR
jgi:hypothetical protein